MNMIVFRSEKNPIIKPADVKPSRADFKVIGVFNCGVTRFNDEILLLLRVAEKPINDDNTIELIPLLASGTKNILIEKYDKNDSSIVFSDPRFLRTTCGKYLTSISHLRIARSKDGINFNIDKEPALFPENDYERFGIEDPRITKINRIYYISYSAISDITGVTVCLASTTDFKTFSRHGVIFMPENKDVAIFPEKIKNKYYALSRPISYEFDLKDMWISASADLICWGEHKRLMGTRKKYWDSSRVGGGAVPFKIEEGWVEIYHGASKTGKYCIGAVLLDAERPWEIIARSKEPIIKPEMDYELNGFFGGVVFTCGVLYEKGVVKIYYGAADTSIAYAEVGLNDILSQLN